MSTLSDLIKQLNTLPLGNVYTKTINGKNYKYYHYFKDGKRYSEIVSEERARELLSLIHKRKIFIKLIKECKSHDKNVVLSKNAKNLTGYLMSGDDVVAEFKEGILLNIDEKRAPLIIKRTHSLEAFLSLRVIDMSRTNARLLKRALNINVEEEYKIPLYAYAISISDNYWFKPKHSKLRYKDIKSNNDIYSDTALKGDMTIFPHQSKLTPEITTTGSFEKGWKLIDNEWWLYKTGNKKQIFSELFCYHFAKLIKLNTAIYEYDEPYIRSKNFADKYNFEPMASLAGDNDNYEHVFNILFDINPLIAKEYIKLIFFDSVVNNIDRHNENVGLLRNVSNGKIFSLAPNFDNNLALISNVDFLPTPKKDGFIKVFVDFLNKNETAKESFKQISFPNIEKTDIERIINSIPVVIDNIDDLTDKILMRYLYLKNMF